MKTYGANTTKTEVASLSRSDSQRRAKAFRSRARARSREECETALSEYLEEAREGEPEEDRCPT